MSDRLLRPAAREQRDIGVRFMLMLLAGIGACLTLFLATAYWIYPSELQDRRFAEPFPHFPAPTLQPSPAADWQTYHRNELTTLNTVGWIDRKAGVVHMPIDQAMAIVARDGIAGWPRSPAASEGSRR